MSVVGYGYTSRDGSTHRCLCHGCIRAAIIADFDAVIPREVMEPLPFCDLYDLVTEVFPEAGDRIGEISPWTADDEGKGLRCQGCTGWIVAPRRDRTPAPAQDLSWAYPPRRRLRRPVPLAELGIELAPAGHARTVAVYKDGYYIGSLTCHGQEWDADADDPYDSPQLAAVCERHRDDALEALLRTVKQRARHSALAIRRYRACDMNHYADLLTRRLAAVPRDRAIPAALQGTPP